MLGGFVICVVLLIVVWLLVLIYSVISVLVLLLLVWRWACLLVFGLLLELPDACLLLVHL